MHREDIINNTDDRRDEEGTTDSAGRAADKDEKELDVKYRPALGGDNMIVSNRWHKTESTLNYFGGFFKIVPKIWI